MFLDLIYLPSYTRCSARTGMNEVTRQSAANTLLCLTIGLPQFLCAWSQHQCLLAQPWSVESHQTGKCLQRAAPIQHGPLPSWTHPAGEFRWLHICAIYILYILYYIYILHIVPKASYTTLIAIVQHSVHLHAWSHAWNRQGNHFNHIVQSVGHAPMHWRHRPLQITFANVRTWLGVMEAWAFRLTDLVYKSEYTAEPSESYLKTGCAQSSEVDLVIKCTKTSIPCRALGLAMILLVSRCQPVVRTCQSTCRGETKIGESSTWH